jgi:hypothetical protein
LWWKAKRTRKRYAALKINWQLLLLSCSIRESYLLPSPSPVTHKPENQVSDQQTMLVKWFSQISHQ